MRWVHLTVIILLAAAILVFILQNRDVVSVSFLAYSINYDSTSPHPVTRTRRQQLRTSRRAPARYEACTRNL
jgi:hypothetical protein